MQRAGSGQEVYGRQGTGKTRSKINRGGRGNNTLCNFVAQFGQGFEKPEGREREGEKEGVTTRECIVREREREGKKAGKLLRVCDLSDDMCGSEKYFHIM